MPRPDCRKFHWEGRSALATRPQEGIVKQEYDGKKDCEITVTFSKIFLLCIFQFLYNDFTLLFNYNRMTKLLSKWSSEAIDQSRLC